jgi:uncharacterized protein DUF4399
MMQRFLPSVLVPFIAGLLHCHAAQAQAGGPSPAGAAVYFIGLKDGDTLAPKTTLNFGLRGMGVAPAGSDRANSGHHHLIIDAPTPTLNVEIPNDFQHLHFGAGQTEAKITLPVGQHKLRLLFADVAHVPHDPAVYSEVINVNVTESGQPPRKKRYKRRHRSWRSY